MPVDKNDPGIGWTIQQETALPDGGEGVPGQVFHTSQLPDRGRQAVELGPNYPDLYDSVGGRLEVFESVEEAKAQPGGPEPGDLESNDDFRKPVEAARAEGAGNNVPPGVGNDYSIQVPSKVEDLEAVVDVARAEKEKAESKDNDQDSARAQASTPDKNAGSKADASKAANKAESKSGSKSE